MLAAARPGTVFLVMGECLAPMPSMSWRISGRKGGRDLGIAGEACSGDGRVLGPDALHELQCRKHHEREEGASLGALRWGDGRPETVLVVIDRRVLGPDALHELASMRKNCEFRGEM